MDNHSYRLMFFLITGLFGHLCYAIEEEKVCLGTNAHFSVTANRTVHYSLLKERFENCTHVNGNLEITWISDPNLDLSFLQHIREVSGYVLIVFVNLEKLALPQLEIIRGRTPFNFQHQEDEFALVVVNSNLTSLLLPSLRIIQNGGVAISGNKNICYLNTINWSKLLYESEVRHDFDADFRKNECPPCHHKCDAGCWGEGEENCQVVSIPDCAWNQNLNECCHEFCAGGCTGPKASDCLRCKYFSNDGVCTDECPPLQVYSYATFTWENNPKGKYAYGTDCIQYCPDYMLKDNGTCVETCPPNKVAVDGECRPNNDPHSKVCKGQELVSSNTIDFFKGCNIIDGDLHILQSSFDGFTDFFPNLTIKGKYPPLHPDQLEVFGSVKEITGFLNIEGSHPDFKSLSYFRNLEVIGGATRYNYDSALSIAQTSLESLNLQSLHTIKSGQVAILWNKRLCFAESVNWKAIMKTDDPHPLIQNNRNVEDCNADGLVCNQACSSTFGCWGLGADQCVRCANCLK